MPGESEEKFNPEIEEDTTATTVEVDPVDDSDEQFEERQAEVQQWIDSQRYLFQMYAGNTGLEMVASDHFGVDAEAAKVHIDTNWAIEHDVNQEQLTWAALQQLGQLQEYRAHSSDILDRLQYENTFGRMRGPLQDLREAIDSVAQDAVIEDRASIYQPTKRGGVAVRELFEQKMYPDGDLRELPQHQQLREALVRSARMPNQELQVSDRVQGILDRPMRVQGKQIKKTLREAMSKLAASHRGRGMTPAERYEMLLDNVDHDYLEMYQEHVDNISKGRNLAEELAEALPSEEQDEYYPRDMESGEGGGKTPHIFQIEPGVTGYFTGGVYEYFDPQTLRWHKKKRLEDYDDSVKGADSSYSGKVHGQVSIPLPKGTAIDAKSLQGDGIKLLRDQHGAFYAESDGLQEFSFQFGKGGHWGEKGRSARGESEELFSEELFSGNLSGETQHMLFEASGVRGASAQADALVAHIREKYTYNIKAQGELYRLGTEHGADTYFQLIDSADELECYTSNTFLVALCRRIGIPARLASGHHVQGTDSEGRSHITRQSGHAWTEIWDGKNWVLKDATPPGNEDGKDDEGDDGEGGEQGEGQPGEKNNEAGEGKDGDSQDRHKGLEDWLNQQEEEKQRRQEQEERQNQSDEERTREEQDRLDREWAEREGISQEHMDRFREVEREVKPYLAELSQLWQQIVHGSIRERKRSREGYFETGISMDIQEVINQWAALTKEGSEGVSVMERDMESEELVRRPELIRIRLSGDLSVSMFPNYNNGSRIKLDVLEQTMVLVLSSIQEFSSYLNLSRRQTKSPLHVDTEVWIYGSSAEKIKPFEAEVGGATARKGAIEVFKHIKARSGTASYQSLEQIRDNLSEEEQAKMKKGEILDIIFDITDGVTMGTDRVRKAVDDLEEMGAVVRSFQIGDVDEDEQRKFHRTWNEGRDIPHGVVVGKNIQQLVPAVTQALMGYLKDVRL